MLFCFFFLVGFLFCLSARLFFIVFVHFCVALIILQIRHSPPLVESSDGKSVFS